MNTWFPNPAEHACSMLDSCHDDLEMARDLAVLNASNSPLGELHHWLDVARILTLEGAHA
jgi:hypothetical protein